VWDLGALALAGPDSTADSTRNAHAQAHGRSDDDESDDDLSPQPLLVGQVLEQVAAARALVCLPLVQDGLSRGPHGALLDPAVDRHLGLLCGGGGEGRAGFDVALERVDVEVRLALGRAGGVQRAAGLGVLVEGRVGVRGVNVHLLLGEVGGGGRHGRLGGGGRAQSRRRYVGARGPLDGDAKGDGAVLLVCCHCDVTWARSVSHRKGQWMAERRWSETAAGACVRRVLSARVAAEADAVEGYTADGRGATDESSWRHGRQDMRLRWMVEVNCRVVVGQSGMAARSDTDNRRSEVDREVAGRPACFSYEQLLRGKLEGAKDG
jgi:hypothetical protein